MSDLIPPEARQAASDAVYALRWHVWDHEEIANAALVAAAPLIAEQARAEERARIAEYLSRAHHGHGLMSLAAFGRELATKVRSGYYIEPPCTCNTIHGMCYVVGCECKVHERVISHG